jgi:hypothetical protein
MLEQDYKDWKSSPVTQQMLYELAEAATDPATKILNRRGSDPLDDQYLKGYIFGLSAAAGWKPSLTDGEGNRVPDEV